MTLVKVKRWAQITLPAEVRKALDIAEGDYLETEIVAGGVLFKPVTVSERKVGWDKVVRILRRSKARSGEAEANEDELMRTVVKEIRAMRRENAKSRPR